MHILQLSFPLIKNLQNLESDLISKIIGFNLVLTHATPVICPADKSFSLTHSSYKLA